MRPFTGILGLIAATMIVNAAPAAAWGPDSWVKRHHRVVHGKPRSVFVDPVGYAYPAIKYREAKSGYRPLPDPTPSAAFRLPPTTTTPAPTPTTPRRR